eukprot:1725698-Prymnesium_polylepis.1
MHVREPPARQCAPPRRYDRGTAERTRAECLVRKLECRRARADPVLPPAWCCPYPRGRLTPRCARLGRVAEGESVDKVQRRSQHVVGDALSERQRLSQRRRSQCRSVRR